MLPFLSTVSCRQQRERRAGLYLTYVTIGSTFLSITREMSSSTEIQRFNACQPQVFWCQKQRRLCSFSGSCSHQAWEPPVYTVQSAGCEMSCSLMRTTAVMGREWEERFLSFYQTLRARLLVVCLPLLQNMLFVRWPQSTVICGLQAALHQRTEIAAWKAGMGGDQSTH